MNDEHSIEMEKLQKEISKLQLSIAQLDGKIASSWALQTRDEYEKSFKENHKQDSITFITKFMIGAIIFLAGAGYFFTKAIVKEVFYDENKELISKMEKKNSESVERHEKKYEWFRNHNYGKNLIYVAESYLHLPDIGEPKRIELVTNLLKRAEYYFNDALWYDSEQATSFWELAELKYYYPKTYKVPLLVNEDEAIENYNKAIKKYEDKDVKKGWRADCYFRLGEIYYERAKLNNDYKKENIETSKNKLLQAKKEYEISNLEGDRKKEKLENVSKYLQELNVL